jgi:hypothetical protein
MTANTTKKKYKKRISLKSHYSFKFGLEKKTSLLDIFVFQCYFIAVGNETIEKYWCFFAS